MYPSMKEYFRNQRRLTSLRSKIFSLKEKNFLKLRLPERLYRKGSKEVRKRGTLIFNIFLLFYRGWMLEKLAEWDQIRIGPYPQKFEINMF